MVAIPHAIDTIPSAARGQGLSGTGDP
jgi:hypothetical protein